MLNMTCHNDKMCSTDNERSQEGFFFNGDEFDSITLQRPALKGCKKKRIEKMACVSKRKCKSRNYLHLSCRKMLSLDEQ